jgi:hypothetical protein
MQSQPRDSLDALRDALQALEAGFPAALTTCLDADVLAACAAGTLPAELRPAALGHLAECRDCRLTMASLARALESPAVRAELASLPDGRAARGDDRLRFALPAAAAAAAVLFVALWTGGGPPPEPAHRAPAITAADNPEPISPLGAARRVDALRWSAVPGVDRYRVTLFDAVGQMLFEADLQDTLVLLPDTIGLLPGRAYFWKVEARTGWDRWSASPLLEFSVDQGREP